MSNIADAFATFLENNTTATLGQDLFISNAPSSNQTTNDLWWITLSGGSKVQTLPTGEPIKAYTINVYRRHRSYQQVYDDLTALEELLNCDGCTQLTGFDTLDIEANLLSVDNDLDSEDRKIGLLQATINTIKEC